MSAGVAQRPHDSYDEIDSSDQIGPIRVTYDKRGQIQMIRKLKSGKYRLYSRKKDPKTGKRRNLGTFDTKEGAKQHEREVQFFKKK